MSKDRSNVVPQVINRMQARAIMAQWLGDKRNRQFVAKNIKADGQEREWRVNPKAGRELIKGVGIAAPTNPDHFKVFDMRTAQGIDPVTKRFCKPDPTLNAWRTFNVGTATYLRRGNEAYTIQG